MYVRIEPVKLIDVLSKMFDSVSFKVNDLLALGTIDKVKWYIYLVTPSVKQDIESLFQIDLVACPRDKNLFIYFPCEIDEEISLFLSDEQLRQLKCEIKQFSFCNGDLYISNDESTFNSSCLELELEVGVELNF